MFPFDPPENVRKPKGSKDPFEDQKGALERNELSQKFLFGE